MTPKVLAALITARRSGAVVLATRLSDGAQLMLPELQAGSAEAVPMAVLQEAAAQAIARDQSQLRTLEGQDWFLHVHAPPYRLIVIGAVHIAQALVPLARTLGYEVCVVDPRTPFNSAERFAQATRVHEWPDEALARLAPDARTAVVALTHDPKLDDPALDQALRTATGYIGALGSRRSHAARLARLALLGHGPEACARVRGPVGLPLGAVSATEIALSILAEIVAVRRGAALGRRDRPWTADAPPQVAALVMAAGRSTRMAPRNKLLLRDGSGRAMVTRVAEACCASRAAHVLVVTGHQPELVERAVRDGQVRTDIAFAHAADHALGLSASLRAGIAALPAETGAALVCLGDMPLVTAALLDRLIAAWSPAADRLVVAPMWQGVRGNPVLWDRRFFAELQALSGDVGARSLLRRHAHVLAEVAADGPGVLTDFDTPESLLAAGAAHASYPS